MLVLPPGYSRLARWLIILVVWLTTFVIPVLSLVILKFTGNIRSLKLTERKDRIVPFFYIAMFYGFTAYYFTEQILVTGVASGIFILAAVIIFLGAIITMFWQISAHALGVGGAVGMLLMITLWMPENRFKERLLVAVLMAGLVMMARLKLQVHTPAQVYSGFLLGLFVSFMIIFWF